MTLPQHLSQPGPRAREFADPTVSRDAGVLQYQRQLRAHPHALAGIRRMVSTRLRAWGYDACRDTAVFCVSELLTNVHQHTTSSWCLLTLRAEHGRLMVTVSDTSPRLPTAGEPDWTSERGRGLFLLQAQARDWGAEPLDAPGVWAKNVWVLLDAPCEEPDPRDVA
ncbi:ATP-binding protein [Streptomyces sp. NPDC005438]|uniref:ATP-binding protein n=1 Tax=Streptomyces sp. NPDC005438 TaxID=3156880 RepID=UPI0033B80F76